MFKDWAVLTLVGREFQALGPAELNDELWHWLFLKKASVILTECVDLSGLLEVLDGSSSVRYFGARLLQHLYTSRQSL